MGNDPRWVPPDSLVEVTCKVIHGLFLLRPSRDLNEIAEGILARAVSRYDVEICAYVVLSNHMHLLLLPADAEQLGLFMGYVNGNLAKEAGRLHRWREHFWGRRYSHVVVSDEPEAHERRLRYLLEQGCRENLVRRPEDWPGVSSTHALLGGQAVRGVWFDRTREYEARRCGQRVGKYEFSEVLEFELAPLPSWRELSLDERRERVSEMIREITAETRQRINETGRAPLGVRKILRQKSARPAGALQAIAQAARPRCRSRGSSRPEDRLLRLSPGVPAGFGGPAGWQARRRVSGCSHRPRLPFSRGQPPLALV